MNLSQATKIAERIRAELAPYCDRIEIAGSIRRRKPEVGDIEIVCIPKTYKTGFFWDDDKEVSCEFCKIVERWPALKGSPTGKYTQRLLPEGINLDIFIASPENWGLIFAIRTGSAEYSHRVLAAGCPTGTSIELRAVYLPMKTIGSLAQRAVIARGGDHAQN